MTTLVHFDARRHRYVRAHDGRTVPGATTLLRRAGKVPEAERLRYAGPYLARGRRVHRATAALDAGAADAYDLLPTKEHGYLRAWEACCRALRPASWTGIEQHGHVDGRVAGTLDRWGLVLTDRLAVVDLKTGRKREWHRYQLAIYALILDAPDALRICAHVGADGSHKFETYEDPSDFAAVQRWTDDWWRHADETEDRGLEDDRLADD